MRLRPSRRRSILVVVHALPSAELSGTPLAAFGYARALGRAGWKVTVLSAAPAGAAPWSEARPEQTATEPFDRVVVPFDLGAGTAWLDAWSVPPAGAADRAPGASTVTAGVADLLRRLDPDVVHIVDNVFLPLSIGELAHDMGIPVVRGVSCAEDLCALIVPVSPCSGRSGFCEAPLSVDHCTECVSRATTDDQLRRFRRTGDAAADERRRAGLHALLAAQRARATDHFRSVYDRVVFASDQFRSYFEQTLPLDRAKVRVVPMGVDVGSATDSGRGGRDDRGGAHRGPVTFAVAGNANPFKGSVALVSTFTHPALSGRDDWRLILAGGGNRHLYGPLLEDHRVADRGPYDHDGLADLLSSSDVGISASVFETFHRVTREYLAGGLPVVGSRAFGISDVVVDGENGLLFDHADPDGLRRAVLRLLDDHAVLDRLRRGAASTTVRSVADEVAELTSIYDELLSTRPGRSRRFRRP